MPPRPGKSSAHHPRPEVAAQLLNHTVLAIIHSLDPEPYQLEEFLMNCCCSAAQGLVPIRYPVLSLASTHHHGGRRRGAVDSSLHVLEEHEVKPLAPKQLTAGPSSCQVILV